MAVLFLVFVTGLLTSPQAGAQVTALDFLRLVNSARANGMGGCVVTLVSEESAYYNPGSVGLFHLDKVVSFVGPHRTKWFPELADDLRLTSWSASVGGSSRMFRKPGQGRDNLSVGVAFSRTRMSYGTYTQLDEIGNIVGEYEPFDAANCLAIGFGWERTVRIGLGYAIKLLHSDLGHPQVGRSADAVAHQFGVLVEVPMYDLVKQDSSNESLASDEAQIRVTPTIAYVLDNVGNGITYREATRTYKLPKMSRLGVSIRGALASYRKEYCSLRGSVQIEKPYVGEHHRLANLGLEAGALKSFFVRIGSTEVEGAKDNLFTWGLGFHLGGLFDWCGVRRCGEDGHGFRAYLARHFDLAVDYAKWSKVEDNQWSNTWFYAVSLSF